MMEMKNKMKESETKRINEMLEIERKLYNLGYENICGVDEAGRGPLFRTSCCSCSNTT